MDLDPSRLRRGEWIVGVSALLLLVFVFALPWYEVNGRIAQTASALGLSTSFNGWHGLTRIRWLILLTVIAAFALTYFQATRRAPALPASFSAIVTVLGAVAVLALIYRVLIQPPGVDSVLQQQAGAYLALASACVLTYGGYESLRREGIAPQDEEKDIELVRLRGTDDS
jgi:hypothetical protein